MTNLINTPSVAGTVAIRLLTANDQPMLIRLAGLDSAGVPAGRLIGAEADGKLVAALSLDEGTVIADPFRPTASAVEMLELRAGQLRDAAAKGRRASRRIRIPRIPRARGALAGSPPGSSNLLRL